ncbi:MAG: hypothetical protein GX240_05630 [Candidatus Atribacteria bacterium]|nr:hypothetical protein [Candidatus Atribacteria bacterium]
MTQSGYFKCPVRLVKDVFSLIEISVSEKAECSFSELVKETRLFKGKVYRLLGTLKSLEYAGHNTETKKYYLACQFTGSVFA